MKRAQSVKLAEVKTMAAKLAKRLKGGEILALIGPLGSGKTAFAKALGKKLGVKRKITSPTFILMSVFPGRLANRKPAAIYHLDLYRTKSWREAKTLGIAQMWGAPGTVTMIEWADKIKKHLPKKTYFLYFRHQ